MVIGNDLMLQLDLLDNINHKGFQWYGFTVPMKRPSIMIGQTYLTSRDMRDVVMQNS